MVEAMPNSDKPEMPQRILKHAEPVFKGANGHIWMKTISLPRDLRVKFPNSLEDEEQNVEGKQCFNIIIMLKICRRIGF